MISSVLIQELLVSQKVLLNYKMYFGETNLINTELDRYLAVTKEDIQRVAKQYYNTNNRVVLHYLPKPVNP